MLKPILPNCKTSLLRTSVLKLTRFSNCCTLVSKLELTELTGLVGGRMAEDGVTRLNSSFDQQLGKYSLWKNLTVKKIKIFWN